MWYHLENIDELDTPALVIYKDRLAHNIQALKASIDDISRLRPHIKTHKILEVVHLMKQEGIEKYKCATIAEAEILGMAEVKDVLLAYPLSIAKQKRWLKLIQAYPLTSFSCLIDNPQSAKDLAEWGLRNDVVFDVFIDVNVGMNRTGLAPDDVIDLYKAISALKNLDCRGLHAYDGHLHQANFQEREKACHQAFQSIENLKPYFEKNLTIIAGGSPTYPIHRKRKDVECSPGTFVFWDDGYSRLMPDEPFIPAALVIGRVISKPTENTICIDIGHKSIAAENVLSKRIQFLNAPHLTFIGQSEEHLTAEIPIGENYHIGDVLYGLPYHICPTVALYEKAFLADNNLILKDCWRIMARDRYVLSA